MYSKNQKSEREKKRKENPRRGCGGSVLSPLLFLLLLFPALNKIAKTRNATHDATRRARSNKQSHPTPSLTRP